MNDPLQPLTALLVAREDLTADTALFQLALADGRGVGPNGMNHKPGQFVMLSVLGAGEAPFSICHAAAQVPILQLCIRRVGRVTERLFELSPGSKVGLRGPYGNGFPLQRMEDHDVLLVAGGLGMAPLRSVLQGVLANRPRYHRVMLAYGFRNPQEMLFGEELQGLAQSGAVELHLAVDQPQPGQAFSAMQGHVGQLVEGLTLEPARTTVALCGPPVMYQGTAEMLRNKGVWPQKTFMTFERRMACGVGQCGHCAIGYRYTCKDGPVFSAWEARGLREAWEQGA
ncbi:Oxidoreductase FAD-binding domain protein [Magnetococcus marinus MC-1]|uniref:Oxidoreductase FAD-binding domain protein n=1 Tax=Magnetococcus marinus (strain ATCC BAA-1437 / JCM 17883 / MC-1) TaxID=156889 RepID=A0L608_MAGMM|nr:FAD/NAD(P)-binding protein [Magnetococcus marinus]ABK43401.1 Oxidoreductase FAD-binding domain protein [Magnetococcus marinus MC-1]